MNRIPRLRRWATGLAAVAIASLPGVPAALAIPLPPRRRHRDPAPAVHHRGRPPPAVDRRDDRGRNGRPVHHHHAHHAVTGTQAPRSPHSGRARTPGRAANLPGHGRTPSLAG